MYNETNDSSATCTNVLTLDGGGIRGLSSLEILKALMDYINEAVQTLETKKQGASDRNGEIDEMWEGAQRILQPRDIFDLVAGTSTGGLIAIMLGKLGMTVDDCIATYEQLASGIFGKKHLRARFTRGFAPARYSASGMEGRMRELLKSKGLDEREKMQVPGAKDKIACAVICREHINKSRYSDFLSAAVCICSLPCPATFECSVCEAARATSAAPTFFPVQKIGNRYFSDGGMEFNNPSLEIWSHYTRPISVAETRRRSAVIEIGSFPGHPGGLDFSKVRIINLGTGDEPPPDREKMGSRFAILIPPPIRMLVSLGSKLKKMAVNAQRTAKVMEALAQVSRNGATSLLYHRFSADNGVCFIKMDEHKKIQELKSKTLDYLRDPTIQRKLQQLAASIAANYIARESARQNQPVINQSSVLQANTSTEESRAPHTILPTMDSASTDIEQYSNISSKDSAVISSPSRQPSTEVTTPGTGSTPNTRPPRTALKGSNILQDSNDLELAVQNMVTVAA
ncbi:uncharacterized protein RSE6_06049 [Rhynchosporium secalis]|uniref:PNPLA domain-containing protein n=1 Tax=Rhynchosporium secalis TaxID=38038 RepID=A0A1E1M9E5_RHYSE|nr:uncharacterized protein RSE6_06049 [Rhynchosporium secalis]